MREIRFSKLLIWMIGFEFTYKIMIRNMDNNDNG